MYLYNITTKITHQIQEDWVQWMQETHIPEIMQTGCFTEFHFLQLLETDDAEGPTYAIQLYAATKVNYDDYLTHFAPSLREKAFTTWGNQFISFRSLMQLVN